MPQEQSGPGRSSSRGAGSGMWPHSPPMALTPSTRRPCTTTPPPTPVPRITPKTTSAPAPPPSTASERAKQLASLAIFTGRSRARGQVAAEVAAVEPGGVALADVAGGAVDRAGDADADALDAAAGLRLEALEEAADGAKAALVVEAGGGDAGAGALGAVGGEHDAFDLGAAVVETQSHRALPRLCGEYYGEVKARATNLRGRRSSTGIHRKFSGWKAAGKWLESGLPLFNRRLTVNAAGRSSRRA